MEERGKKTRSERFKTVPYNSTPPPSNDFKWGIYLMYRDHLESVQSPLSPFSFVPSITPDTADQNAAFYF